MPEMTAPVGTLRVLVTGGASGIGAATALLLHRQGHQVIVADRHASAARALVERLPGAHALHVDVADARSVADLFRTVHRTGPLDALVHCPAIGLTKPLIDVDRAEWEQVLQINLTGAFLCCTEAARGMVAAGGGSIVALGSVAGQRPSAMTGPYSASKAALELLVLGLAMELGAHKVRANIVAPGPTDTELVKTLHAGDRRARFAARVPLARYARADEIAASAAFLVSPQSSFITGQVLYVDGGMGIANVLPAPAENRP